MKEKSVEKSEHVQQRRQHVGFEKDKNIEKIDSKVLSHRDNYYRVSDSHQQIDIDTEIITEEEKQKGFHNKGGNYERQPVYEGVMRELPPQSHGKKISHLQQRPLLSQRKIDNSKHFKNNQFHHGHIIMPNSRKDVQYQNVKAPNFPGNQGDGKGNFPSVNQGGNVHYPLRGNLGNENGHFQSVNQGGNVHYPQRGNQGDGNSHFQSVNQGGNVHYPQKGNRGDGNGHFQSVNQGGNVHYPQKGNRGDGNGHFQSVNQSGNVHNPQRGNRGDGHGHFPSVNQGGNVHYPQRGPPINGRQNYDRYEHPQYNHPSRDQFNVQQSRAGNANTNYQPQKRRATNISKAIKKYVANALPHGHGPSQDFVDPEPNHYEGTRYVHIEQRENPTNRYPVNQQNSGHGPGLIYRRRDSVNSEKTDPQIDTNRDVQYVMRSKSASRERLMSGKHSNQLPQQPGDRGRQVSGKQSNRIPQQPGDNRLPPQSGDKKLDAWDKNYLSEKTDRHEKNGDQNKVNLEKQKKMNAEKHLDEGKSDTRKGYVFPDTDDIEDIDPDDIEEEYTENEIYLCYLMTESGAIAGPLQLNIDNVQIGLPSQVQFNNNKNNLQENSETNDEKENDEGMRNRQTGSHGLNETSSRSHSMLTLTIDSEIQDPEDENLYLTKRGKLTFVDLAGSEKVKESNSSAETLIESNNINRSLLVLGNCISSLGDAKKRQGHIPYRDSKLTKLLADSLGGQGVTLMIACVTPSSHHAAESINTLRYASRAKRIRTKPIVKMDPREKLIMSLKREVKALRNENVYLRQQLEFPAKTARPVGTQRENEEKINKIMKEKETHKNNVDPQVPKGNTDEAGLYEMLQEYMIENEALRTENSEMHSNKDKVKREQQNLYKENERLLRRIEDLQREKRAIERRSNPPPQDPYYTSPHQSPIPMGYGRPPPPQGNVQQWSNQPVQYPADQYSGYNSPNAGNRGKPPPHGVPKRPPHRLPPDPIMRQGHPPPQELIQNGIYNDEGYMSPNGRQPYQNGNRQDNIRNMNEKLKQELMQLDGEIEQSQVVNYRTRSLYGSQASLRSGPR
ncbi:hypothetical protein KUTeg_009976 [Tegillarca granosa]|uniref:Kinesin motor domain-containing protein n=1 Tax=Tegillarca granosa TaxID=220873 RepID=A0ABQ9F5E5_TEGGR|nr:hypothetical protein KUTeg_009976 [Tegillarca granosa]